MNVDAAKPFLLGLFFIAMSVYLVVDRAGTTRRSIESYTFWVRHPHLFTFFMAALGVAVMVMAAVEIRQGVGTGVAELCLGLALTLGAPGITRVYIRGLRAWASRPLWIEWSWLASAGMTGLAGVAFLVLAMLSTRATPS